MSTSPNSTSTRPGLHEVLARVHLFRELEPEWLERLAAGARLFKAERGEVLFEAGDPATGFYYLIQGRVKLVLLSPSGAEKVVEIVREGMTFGEAVVFIEQPFPVTAQATEPSHVLYMGRSALLECVGHDPAFAFKMLAGLSRRLHSIVRDVESYSLCSATQRVIGYLLREAEAPTVDGRCTIELPATKAVVASRLNLTPETLSRALHELSDLGLISVHGRTIEIVDLNRLCGDAQ